MNELPSDYAALRQAFRPRDQDILLAHDLEDARSQIPCERTRQEDAERKRRKDDRPQAGAEILQWTDIALDR